MRDYKPKADYTPKGNQANMMKFRLDSQRWTPSNPGCLGFDASEDPMEKGGSPKFIGAWDPLHFNLPTVITGIAQLDPSFDPVEVGKKEGIEFSEPEIAEVRRTGAVIPMIGPPFYAEAHGRAAAIKELLTVLAMPYASTAIREFCRAAAEKIATEDFSCTKE